MSLPTSVLLPLIIGSLFGLVFFIVGRQFRIRHQAQGGLAVLPSEEQSYSLETGGRTVSVEYKQHIPGKNGRPASLRLMVPQSFASALFMTLETKSDFHLRRWGFSDEVTVGKQQVDSIFHIVAMEASKARALLGLPKVEELIRKAGAIPGFESFQVRDDHILISFRSFSILDQSFEDFVRGLSEDLSFLCEQAKDIFGSQSLQQTRVFAKRFDLFNSRTAEILPILAFFGAAVWCVLSFFFAEPLHAPDASVKFFSISLALLILLVSLLRPWIRSLMMPSRSFLSLFISSALAFWAFSAGALNLLNRRLDSSQPQVFEAEIQDVYFIPRKNGRTHYLQVSTPDESSVFHRTFTRIQVGETIYHQAKANRDTVTVTWHPGTFQVPWIDGWKINYKDLQSK